LFFFKEPALDAPEKTGCRVALFYDEAESLYSKDTEERQQFVEELQVLANTGSESCSTLLCGSATNMDNCFKLSFFIFVGHS